MIGFIYVKVTETFEVTSHLYHLLFGGAAVPDTAVTHVSLKVTLRNTALNLTAFSPSTFPALFLTFNC